MSIFQKNIVPLFFKCLKFCLFHVTLICFCKNLIFILPCQVVEVLCQSCREQHLEQQGWQVVVQEQGSFHTQIGHHVQQIASQQHLSRGAEALPLLCEHCEQPSRERPSPGRMRYSPS